MTLAPLWQIWADTGGTFTDCLAVDPAGRLHRAKVLSTSAVRGRIAARLGAEGDDTLRVEPGWAVPAGFFRGFSFRLLEEDAASVEVLDWQPEERLLRLASALPQGDLAGATFELRSPEEAPVLAARLVTGTALDAPLPPIAMRLATTRGTNALLERKGAATALFITRGFADVLVIGTQARPDLFALEIVRPAPLYREVVEVPERLAADGSVLLPLDVEALRETVRRLLEEGIESAAVALMHSYRNPRHEEELGDLLRAAGFRHVSLSSRLAPLIKLLSRAETAVVDAYLSPILERYLSGVAGALGPGSLHVMTSAGGLVRASSFRAKDGLLSGPAGGVVGAALAGRSSGFSKVIAFDMGGTSTDVARWDGDFEYLFEHRVGDAHLVAPALAIESVAAGGGSICSFDGAQLKVGPESAGAWPGPACYGAGGPLTLTDVNLILGRIDPSRFEIPLNPEASEAALAGLRAAMGASGDGDPGPEAVLSGLLEIADERMAEAIRAISLRRGFDPAGHALVAFGGAGAQHACAVAGLLGISSVVVPADAGLLSALGLGAAVVERFAHRQVLEPLARVRDRVAGWLAELGKEAAAAVETEGTAPEEITVRRRLLNLRFTGQEASLAVEYEGDDALEPAFDAAYREIYGYAPEGRAIELESVRVVASSRPAGEAAGPSAPSEAHKVVPVGTRRCWTGAGWREVPLFDRSALGSGATFAGPSLVFENHSATFVGEAWGARVDGAGHLVLVSTRAVE
ncbi:MAG TPA: hydantoinase/oxoprolinase family protein [Thermoanaerobaculia bacterium]|nr:hydantoinase/oxoprolinase family protein [Thermoanaerobaculia bacterium]